IGLTTVGGIAIALPEPGTARGGNAHAVLAVHAGVGNAAGVVAGAAVLGVLGDVGLASVAHAALTIGPAGFARSDGARSFATDPLGVRQLAAGVAAATMRGVAHEVRARAGAAGALADQRAAAAVHGIDLRVDTAVAAAGQAAAAVVVGGAGAFEV